MRCSDLFENENDVSGFFDDVEAHTMANPLNPKQRVYGDSVIELSSNKNGSIQVDDIRAFAPGSGAGTKSLKFLTNLADKHKVTLELFAVAYLDKKKTPALKQWYKYYGFVEKGQLMIREPKRTIVLKLRGFDRKH